MLWLILLPPAHSADERLLLQREYFRQAWSALARADWDRARAISAQLSGYPLLPYLRAEQIRQRSSAFSEAEVQRFLEQYHDWAFHATVRRNWLRTLGRDGQFESLLQHANANDTDTEIRCHLARAHIAVGDNKQDADLIAKIQALWLLGKSQHKACDSAFDWLREHDGISSELAWQRLGLAMAAGNTGLASYLQRYLSAEHKTWAQRWLQMARAPTATLRQALSWPDQSAAWTISSYGLSKLARSDHAQAYRYWQQLDKHFNWPADVRAQALHESALYAALELQTEALQMIDQLPETASDPQLLAWRVRVALANAQWPEVLTSIARMRTSERQDSRWRYWQAQALRASGAISAADELLGKLSNEADYHGFLAADWLQQPYSICAQPEVEGDWRSLPTAAQLQRAIELYHVNLGSYANTAWHQAVAPLNKQERIIAAALAADHQWWLQSVMTLTDAEHREHYTLRFPVTYQPLVRRQASRYQLEEAFIYGLMRAESAMNPQAVSGADARGLMQVTPATARAIARRNGTVYRGSASLLAPETNVSIGTAFLAEMFTRYEHNPIQVLAAYNAGPQVVARWQQQPRPERPDIWVETLPYFETRDYIPRVLAFSVIYDWRLHGTVTPISARMPGLPDNQSWAPTQLRREVKCNLPASEPKLGGDD